MIDLKKFSHLILKNGPQKIDKRASMKWSAHNLKIKKNNQKMYFDVDR